MSMEFNFTEHDFWLRLSMYVRVHRLVVAVFVRGYFCAPPAPLEVKKCWADRIRSIPGLDLYFLSTYFLVGNQFPELTPKGRTMASI